MASVDNIHRVPAPGRRHIPKGTEVAVRTQTGTHQTNIQTDTQARLHMGAADSRSSVPDSSHPCTGARYIRASRSGVRSPHVAAGRRCHIARSHIARNHMAHSHIGRSRMTDTDSRLDNSIEAGVGIVVGIVVPDSRDLRCAQMP